MLIESPINYLSFRKLGGRVFLAFLTATLLLLQN